MPNCAPHFTDSSIPSRDVEDTRDYPCVIHRHWLVMIMPIFDMVYIWISIYIFIYLYLYLYVYLGINGVNGLHLKVVIPQAKCHVQQRCIIVSRENRL